MHQSCYNLASQLASYAKPASAIPWCRTGRRKCLPESSVTPLKFCLRNSRNCDAANTQSEVLLSGPSKMRFKLCMLCKYVFGRNEWEERRRRRDERWKVVSHIPKCHFRVAEVPLFTGLWWRGALIATSCFSTSLVFFPSPLLVWEKSPDAVKWAMMTYVDAGLFISLWGL